MWDRLGVRCADLQQIHDVTAQGEDDVAGMVTDRCDQLAQDPCPQAVELSLAPGGRLVFVSDLHFTQSGPLGARESSTAWGHGSCASWSGVHPPASTSSSMLVALLSGYAALRPGREQPSRRSSGTAHALVFQLVYSLGDTMGPALSLGNSVDNND